MMHLPHLSFRAAMMHWSIIALLAINYQVDSSEKYGKAITEVCSKTTNDELSMESLPSLGHARRLEEPIPKALVGGEFENSDFWETNGKLLRDAWKEYYQESMILSPMNNTYLFSPEEFDIDAMIHPHLARAVANAWKNPGHASESIVRKQFKQVTPDGAVFSTQLIQPLHVQALREEIDAIEASGLPTRRPNGMNRYGHIFDEGIDGAVALPSLNRYCTDLVDRYVRPIGRMLFPEDIGIDDDVEAYAFSIQYKEGQDLKLNEHRDASVVTININLNLPEEDYDGSSLYFVNQDKNSDRNYLSFSPGTAIIHKGSVRHAAASIESGERHNLVIWLFGNDGVVRVEPYNKMDQLTAEERWGVASKSIFK